MQIITPAMRRRFAELEAKLTPAEKKAFDDTMTDFMNKNTTPVPGHPTLRKIKPGYLEGLFDCDELDAAPKPKAKAKAKVPKYAEWLFKIKAFAGMDVNVPDRTLDRLIEIVEAHEMCMGGSAFSFCLSHSKGYKIAEPLVKALADHITAELGVVVVFTPVTEG